MKFDTLDSIYNMFTPIDVSGKVEPDLGGALQNVNPAFKELVSILENNGRGVLSINDVIERIKNLKLGAPTEPDKDLSKYITIWSMDKVPSTVNSVSDYQKAVKPDGSVGVLNGLNAVLGKDFSLDGVSSPNCMIALSRTPFFNPATRDTRRAEILLNSMPSVTLSQLTPFMQVEFQIRRNSSDKLQSLSQLKLLLGAENKSTLKSANKAMLDGHQTNVSDRAGNIVSEIDYAGMEIFTSPITLTNPTPNKDVGTNGARYVDVLDPFRPFATLENVTISAKPSGAGFYCYKKANMTIKVHDRSRLNEISDLIRPRVYTGVTIWMTYGWRAPSSGNRNPYFSYINNNMLVREAYGIVNSSFSFDNLGQVTINLELFTKGVTEMRELRIGDGILDMAGFSDLQKLKNLTENISERMRALNLQDPEGLNKEVRTFQILGAAQAGEFPDIQPFEVKKKIQELYNTLNKVSKIDHGQLDALKKDLDALYAADKSGKKYALKEAYNRQVKNTIDKMFEEVRTGLDPFIPTLEKKDNFDPELIQICERLNPRPKAGDRKVFQKKVVSFGKLFTIFALRSLLSMPETLDEVQIFFYSLNDQCGPVRNISIAEFPIDIQMFVDQFNELVVSRGGQSITLEDFLQLAINSQFLDNRAPGYGLRDFYKSYVPGKSIELNPGAEGKFESKLSQMTQQHGPFKKPVVEMYIEMTHQRVSSAGESDNMQKLNYSAKDAELVSIGDENNNASKKILRVHVYDKSVNSYKAAGQLLKSPDNSGFISVSSDATAQSVSSLQNIVNAVKGSNGENVLIGKPEEGKTLINKRFVNNQEIKDIVSKFVPMIRFGTNGTTITTANLSSKAEPLLSTTQMIRSQTVTNTAGPNGSGDKLLGIPLRVIPAQLKMTTFGNPLATMAQQYFVDFQTGTTLDNLYIVTGLDHSFAPGKFETSWTFGYSDGYGVFEGAPNIIEQLNRQISLATAASGQKKK